LLPFSLPIFEISSIFDSVSLLASCSIFLFPLVCYFHLLVSSLTLHLRENSTHFCLKLLEFVLFLTPVLFYLLLRFRSRIFYSLCSV
jgi:hypothetical protein